MATWDASLPQYAKVDGYRIAPVAASRRTDMESGAGKSRRITYARNDRVSVSWQMTDAQLDTFRTWFDDDAQAAGGSAWFYISLAVGGTGLESVEARFVGEYSIAAMEGLNWVVSATLEVR